MAPAAAAQLMQQQRGAQAPASAAALMQQRAAQLNNMFSGQLQEPTSALDAAGAPASASEGAGGSRPRNVGIPPRVMTGGRAEGKRFFWRTRDGILEHPLSTFSINTNALHGLDEAPSNQRQGVLLAVCDML